MKRQGRISGKAVFILIVLAAGGGWYYFHRGEDKNAKGQQALPISVAHARRQDVAMEIHEVGNVVAYETVAVRPRLDSQIMEVKFKDGDYVQKGALLFVLDDRTLRAQVGELEANVTRDKAQLENLRQQLARSEALTAKGYESPANLDEARAAQKAQAASANASQAALDSLKVQLGYTHITAPISGRTGTINYTVGNTIKVSDPQPLVTINQVRPIRVQFSLAQHYFDAVVTARQAGKLEAIAARQGATEQDTGTLEYIDNAVDATTGTFVARAVFPNAGEKLWPGMFVNVTLNLGVDKQALVVPEVAVQHGQAGDFVFVIADNKAARRDIKVSRMQENVAVIDSGLEEGDAVAIDGLMNLKDGTAVNVKNAAPKEDGAEVSPKEAPASPEKPAEKPAEQGSK